MPSTVRTMVDEGCPPKTKYSVEDIPDLTGKVTVVTGGNSGLGWETAKALLNRNAKVYIASRSQEKAEAAIKSLKDVTGRDAWFLKLDLASLKSVKAAAQEFSSKESELHILFCNGGVMGPPVEQLTADGYDLQFGTNVIGHYYFATLLTPMLLSGTKTSGDGTARVVFTSSAMHMLSGLDFKTFTDGPERRKKSLDTLYAQSKYGNVVVAAEIARRYGDHGIVSTAVNPGNLKSDLQRHMTGVQKFVVNQILQPTAMGALTQLYAGTSPEGKYFNGKYLKPWARMGEARADSQDLKIGKELWDWLEEQTGSI